MTETYLNFPYYLKKYLGELPDPALDPETRLPVNQESLARIFPLELINQEVTLDKEVEIPDEVRDIYSIYRPTPLLRAERLEKFLDTPAKIYYKYEGASPVGSHKFNTAVAQAFFNKREGIKTLVTETGAGQWGSALSLACRMFGLSCRVYMVRASYEQKPYRKVMMQTYGASVEASPSRLTRAGRGFLADKRNINGSLGMAISEAIETVVSLPKAHYALGSVLNHVMLHQTVIGNEAREQMEKLDLYPDTVVGCCGGGSNLAGIAFPFLADTLTGDRRAVRVVAVEPKVCPSLTKGEYRYDTGDTAGLTPLLKMYTVGSKYMPPPDYAGGLRYHGDSPLVSFCVNRKLIEAVAYNQKETFKAAVDFARCEGIIPAPESAYAIRQVMAEANKARIEGKKKTILFCLSGHGLLDMAAYENFLSGKF